MVGYVNLAFVWDRDFWDEDQSSNVAEATKGTVCPANSLERPTPSTSSGIQADNEPIEMPSARSEETALLSLVPNESMDDIELNSILVQFPLALQLSEVGGACPEVRVRTDRGELLVAVQGDRAKPAIITYHDIGFNHTCFKSFFSYVDMLALLENFCVYHVNAPGQEEGAPAFPVDYLYPTMDELASQISFVLVHFGIKSFIGFGVGAGANVLARFALGFPGKVDALVLVNCSPSQAGWIEWASHKIMVHSLRSRGLSSAAVDALVSHHLGRNSEQERTPDVLVPYRSHFRRCRNPGNLALFIDSYTRRSDLGISRGGITLRPPVLNLAGALSPMLEDTIVLNTRLNPSTSTWMKISDSAVPQDEKPETVSEAFRLFLQGEGYAVLALHRIGSPHTRPASAAGHLE